MEVSKILLDHSGNKKLKLLVGGNSLRELFNSKAELSGIARNQITDDSSLEDIKLASDIIGNAEKSLININETLNRQKEVDTQNNALQIIKAIKERANLKIEAETKGNLIDDLPNEFNLKDSDFVSGELDINPQKLSMQDFLNKEE